MNIIKLPHPGSNILFKVCRNSPLRVGKVDQSPHPLTYPPLSGLTLIGALYAYDYQKY